MIDFADVIFTDFVLYVAGRKFVEALLEPLKLADTD